MKNKGTVLIALSIAAVMACVGVGYAAEYSASTSNSNNTLASTYMLLELNDNAVTSECTFQFDDLVYYRDRTISGSTVTDVYRFTSKDSGMVKVYINGTNLNNPVINMSVNLTETDPLDTIPVTMDVDGEMETVDVPVASLVLQFYELDTEAQEETWVPFGDPVKLTTSPQTVSQGQSHKEFSPGPTEYRCKATITINNFALDAANNGIGDQPATGGIGTVTFGITFTATAVES